MKAESALDSIIDEHRQDPGSVLTPAQKNMIAGGVAGCVGKTATAPLSRLTVLYQVSSLFTQPKISTSFRISSSDNLFHTLRNIVKREGIWALWNGNLTSVIHRFPYSAINFSTFEATKNYLSRITDSYESFGVRFVSGAVAGGTACVMCYPLDLVRTRLTVANSFSSSPKITSKNNNRYPGGKIVKVVVRIITQEGLPGLYRGLPISLFVTMPNLAISFATYGFVKESLFKMGGALTYDIQKDGQIVKHLSPVGSLLSGCLSGMASSCVIFPADVVRKRMQVMGGIVSYNKRVAQMASANSSNNNCGEAILSSSGNTTTGKSGVHNPMTSRTILGEVQHILHTDGVRGFYRGLAPEILKVCPMVAIMFCSYELVQDLLDKKFPSSSRHL